jgi:hypothetical protein
MRQIELAYFDENPNGRRFINKYLHKEIKNSRAEILSALNAIVVNWAKKGFPKGKTAFSSYPEWAEIVGGMMAAAELGDPCLPFKSGYEIGGDLKTEAMTELFRVCHAAFGDNVWVEKPAIYKCVRNAAKDNDALHWFGELGWDNSARTRARWHAKEHPTGKTRRRLFTSSEEMRRLRKEHPDDPRLT